MSVAWGMVRDEALKALTINAAEILGVADRVGSLEAGKDANLFISKGDPLEVRPRDDVFINGQDVGLDNKHYELYQKYLARPSRRPVMIRAFRFSLSILAIALAAGVAARADAPHVYAITGARLVTVAGPAVAAGTIVVRNGLIEAVGAGVQPPADAVIIDGAGSTVYPGLIDMGTSAGLDIDLVTQQPSTIRTFDESERWKRDLVLRSGVLAAEHVKADAPELTKLAAAGITTVLATPPGVLFKGHSALVNVVTPAESPIVGAIAPPRSGVGIVKSPVALHVQFQAPRGDGYPVALLGAIAFVRQTFIDAEYQRGLEAAMQKRRPDPPGRASIAPSMV